MPVWNIQGGNKLEGSLTVQGSKNAVLPILAACLLNGGQSRLEHCPRLLDVEASAAILRHLGCRVGREGQCLTVDSAPMGRTEIPHELMLKMRSSVIFLGAILARCGEARLSMPGGCELGPRPIDLHLRALRELGAEIREEGGELRCTAPRLTGCRLHLEFPSVGATENVMLAACGAAGETVLTNAAREPEIVALQDYLNAAGGQVSGAGSPEIRIGPFRRRNVPSYRIPADRIAAATYLCAAAAAGGEVLLERAAPGELVPVCMALREMGCLVTGSGGRIRLRSDGNLRAVSPVVTRPYPGFPTDAQAPLMAAVLRAEGTSVFVENLFESRFRHVPELRRMGAKILTEGRVAMVTGVGRLTGGPVQAWDLRGGAAMIVAGLAAEGETSVLDSGHVERGYERIAENLCSLGGRVRRLEREA